MKKKNLLIVCLVMVFALSLGASSAKAIKPFKGLADIPEIKNKRPIHIALEAADTLHEKGVTVRVVSMPSWELFDRQSEAYQSRVLPVAVKARVAVEAGIIQGWHRYLGEKGEFVGGDHFGASAPYKT